MNPVYARHRDKMIKYTNTKHNQRHAKGLCIECGKPNDRGAHTSRCAKCLVISRKRINKMQEERMSSDSCVRCGHMMLNDTNTRLCDDCRTIAKKDSAKYRDKTKDVVFAAYGGYKCSCCGETRKSMLQLDHLKNDGRGQRLSVGCSKGGMIFYRWLIKNNFPKILQVLCANCNWSKRKNNGICEHQTERAAALVVEATGIIKVKI